MGTSLRDAEASLSLRTKSSVAKGEPTVLTGGPALRFPLEG